MGKRKDKEKEDDEFLEFTLGDVLHYKGSIKNLGCFNFVLRDKLIRKYIKKQENEKDILRYIS